MTGSGSGHTFVPRNTNVLNQPHQSITWVNQICSSFASFRKCPQERRNALLTTRWYPPNALDKQDSNDPGNLGRCEHHVNSSKLSPLQYVTPHRSFGPLPQYTQNNRPCVPRLPIPAQQCSYGTAGDRSGIYLHDSSHDVSQSNQSTGVCPLVSFSICLAGHLSSFYLTTAA
jgi:hypothetical protein